MFEADAVGDLTQISVVKENDQLSELTFEVIGTLTLESGVTAARLDPPGADFAASPRVQVRDFHPDEQAIQYVFELFDDDIPEATETFQFQLSLGVEGVTTRRISLGR